MVKQPVVCFNMNCHYGYKKKNENFIVLHVYDHERQATHIKLNPMT